MNKVTRIKNTNYTTISNVFLRDKELSLKAKGLLATILSLPENWDFSIKGICATIKEGTTAVYSAIDELKERGYCKVVTNRNEKGMIVGNDYTFYEDPNVENLNMGNQAQINTNISLPNTKETINKEIKKEEKEIDKSISKSNKELFEECWLSYNRKGSKKKALEQWQKISDETKAHILTHIKAYVGSRDRQFQKDFERYLRDKTFNDVVYKGNSIIYDSMDGVGDDYMPATDGAIKWNETNKCYIYIGMFFGYIPDGYTDDNRPNHARIMLNNGGGMLEWDSETKKWNKI